jgi:hypothetical protein
MPPSKTMALCSIGEPTSKNTRAYIGQWSGDVMIIIAQRQRSPIALALHPREAYDYNWVAEVDLWQLCR